MHQTRQEMSKRLPLPRKGTTYVARAASHHTSAVPVLIAVRDMLNLAHSAREVKAMIHQKVLKLNGRAVRDMHESIKLFGQLEADKTYRLTLLPTGKFIFRELKKAEDKLCKVIGKRLVAGGKIQLSLHDGTNVIMKDGKIATGDSLYLDEKNKVKAHLPIEKGREALVVKGKHQGRIVKITHVEGKNFTVHHREGGGTTTLTREALFVTN